MSVSGQELGFCGGYTGPGGPWDQFPPSSTPNGGRSNELCPKKIIKTIKVMTMNMRAYDPIYQNRKLVSVEIHLIRMITKHRKLAQDLNSVNFRAGNRGRAIRIEKNARKNSII